ncbi:MAG: hypothetical protein [Podoviridae sp. ctviO18]|nr:MAG: hypothetical protein [Podoviridae sp. ctviO18]
MGGDEGLFDTFPSPQLFAKCRMRALGRLLNPSYFCRIKTT